MIRIIVTLLVVVGAASANPFLLTYISEVGFDSAGRPWVEFCVQPWEDEGYLHDVLLVTGSSVCTLDFDLGPGEFVVLDSEVVAQGELAHGTFRLNPLADSLMLRSDFIGAESVRYPVFPTGLGSAPAPPPGASVAFCNSIGEVDACNWYVDSTPTRGGPNDDYSSIGGRVDMDSTFNLQWVSVRASGRYGTMFWRMFDTVGEYVLPGLGAGAYLVTMAAYVQELGYVEVPYPESVRVGYSQAIGGINFRIPSSAVADQRQPRAPVTPPAATVMRELPVGAVAFDAMGRRAVNPKSGVFFVRERSAVGGERPAVTVRKVILQR